MCRGRWEERCIVHYDEEVIFFFKSYFKDNQRKVLLITGAGFDPRSTQIIQNISQLLNSNLEVILIKEERPNPDHELVKRAANNTSFIQTYCTKSTIKEVPILAEDNAVIGGRNVIRAVAKINILEYTDVVIDTSALSIGISSPLILFFYKKTQPLGNINLHLTVVSNPTVDSLIRSTPHDQMSEIHGFELRELFGENEKAQLWLPSLSEKKHDVLRLIHSALKPHDTCPILPFPSENPKKGDRIACDLFNTIQIDWNGILENEWNLDPRNFVYADERKPLDIYRTILRLDDERKPVFETFGGSTIVLSPIGSKIPAIGVIMAALERKFPMVYVEALSYQVDWAQVDKITETESKMTHIWLNGEAYLKTSY